MHLKTHFPKKLRKVSKKEPKWSQNGTQMDPKTLAVNGRRSTAFSKNIRRFRAPSLQIFLRLTDPPIFNNIGFTSVKQRFSRSRLSEKNATTIPQGYQNDLKFDPTSCQKDAEIGSTTCSKGIPENDTPKLTPHHPKKDPKGARRDKPPEHFLRPRGERHPSR